MTNRMQDAIAWAAGKALATAGERVLYRVDADHEYWIDAIPANYQDRSSDDRPVAKVDATDQDFLVLRDDLDGYEITPAPGHRITRMVGRSTIVYQLATRRDQACAVRADQYHVMMRLHAKQIS